MPADRLARLLRASRFGFVILGGLYTVGLLIVNIDLAGYGRFARHDDREDHDLVGTGNHLGQQNSGRRLRVPQ